MITLIPINGITSRKTNALALASQFILERGGSAEEVLELARKFDTFLSSTNRKPHDEDLSDEE